MSLGDDRLLRPPQPEGGLVKRQPKTLGQTALIVVVVLVLIAQWAGLEQSRNVPPPLPRPGAGY